MENEITFIQSACVENKITIQRFQDFILDVDCLNDTIKIIEDAWWDILK